MSLSFIDIEYPKKLLEDLKRGKKLKLFDLVKTGMVVSILTDDNGSYDAIEGVFRERLMKLNSSFMAFADLDELEIQFQRKVEVWKNSGNKTLDVIDTLSLFWTVCYLQNSLLTKQDPEKTKIMFSEGVEFTFENPIAKLHYGLWSSHEDLIVGKIEDYWQRKRTVLREKLIKPKRENKRRPLPKGIRHEVFKRDGFRCTECGIDNTKTTLHVDHILPVSKGGSDELSNLRTLCDSCNLEKNDLAHGDKS